MHGPIWIGIWALSTALYFVENEFIETCWSDISENEKNLDCCHELCWISIEFRSLVVISERCSPFSCPPKNWKFDGCGPLETSFLVLSLSYIKVRVFTCTFAVTQSKKLQHGKFGKDPTVETSFLPDRYGNSLSLLTFSFSLSLVLELTFDVRGDEEILSVSERRRNKLNVKGCRDSGFLSRSRFEVMLFFDTGKFCMNVWKQFFY